MIREHSALMKRVEEYMCFLAQVMEKLEELHHILASDRLPAYD